MTLHFELNNTKSQDIDSPPSSQSSPKNQIKRRQTEQIPDQSEDENSGSSGPCMIPSVARCLLAKRQRQQLISTIDRIDPQNEKHQELVISVLQDTNKTLKDIAYLKKAISNLPLFLKSPELLSSTSAQSFSLFQEFSYQFCRKNEIVFNCGDFGYTYYIVLKGAVYLFIPKLTKDDNRSEKDNKLQNDVNMNKLKYIWNRDRIGSATSVRSIPCGDTNQLQSQLDLKDKEVSEKISPLKKQRGWGLIQQNLRKVTKGQQINSGTHINFAEESTESASNLKKIFDDMNLIKTFSAGEAFGEISLITNQRRTGTMICKEDTHLMTLTKHGFENILGQYHAQLKSERLGFLKSFSFFTTIPNSNLLSILHDIRIESLQNRTTLFTQGSPVENIILLKSGEIQLSRSILEDPHTSSQSQQSRSGSQQNINNATSATPTTTVTSNFNTNSNNHSIDYTTTRQSRQQKNNGEKTSADSEQNTLNKLSKVSQNKKKKLKPVLLSTQCSNSHFGLEDLLIDIDRMLASTQISYSSNSSNSSNNKQQLPPSTHSMTAEVISEVAEVYILNKNIFLNNLLQFKVLDVFRTEIKQKMDYLSSREQSVAKISEISNKSMQRLIKNISLQQSQQHHLQPITPIAQTQSVSPQLTSSLPKSPLNSNFSLDKFSDSIEEKTGGVRHPRPHDISHSNISGGSPTSALNSSSFWSSTLSETICAQTSPSRSLRNTPYIQPQPIPVNSATITTTITPGTTTAHRAFSTPKYRSHFADNSTKANTATTNNNHSIQNNFESTFNEYYQETRNVLPQYAQTVLSNPNQTPKRTSAAPLTIALDNSSISTNQPTVVTQTTNPNNHAIVANKKVKLILKDTYRASPLIKPISEELLIPLILDKPDYIPMQQQQSSSQITTTITQNQASSNPQEIPQDPTNQSPLISKSPPQQQNKSMKQISNQNQHRRLKTDQWFFEEKRRIPKSTSLTIFLQKDTPPHPYFCHMNPPNAQSYTDSPSAAISSNSSRFHSTKQPKYTQHKKSTSVELAGEQTSFNNSSIFTKHSPFHTSNNNNNNNYFNLYNQKSPTDVIVNFHMHNKLMKSKSTLVHQGVVKMIPKNQQTLQQFQQKRPPNIASLLESLPPLTLPKFTLK